MYIQRRKLGLWQAASRDPNNQPSTGSLSTFKGLMQLFWVGWLHAQCCGYMWNKFILKYFRNNFSVYFTWFISRNLFHISHFTHDGYIQNNDITSKSFQPLKLFQNYFSDIEQVGKHSWPVMRIWNYFEIILAEIISIGTSTKVKINLK